jgi:hypothetical protein
MYMPPDIARHWPPDVRVTRLAVFTGRRKLPEASMRRSGQLKSDRPRATGAWKDYAPAVCSEPATRAA